MIEEKIEIVEFFNPSNVKEDLPFKAPTIGVHWKSGKISFSKSLVNSFNLKEGANIEFAKSAKGDYYFRKMYKEEKGGFTVRSYSPPKNNFTSYFFISKGMARQLLTDYGFKNTTSRKFEISIKPIKSTRPGMGNQIELYLVIGKDKEALRKQQEEEKKKLY